MKFLANENVPLASITRLKNSGFDIKAIGSDNPGVSDAEVMMLAIDEFRTIITYDSDYGELIFKYGYRPMAGVIFIRNQPADPFETATIIDKLTMNKGITFERALTVVDKDHIRQKRF